MKFPEIVHVRTDELISALYQAFNTAVVMAALEEVDGYEAPTVVPPPPRPSDERVSGAEEKVWVKFMAEQIMKRRPRRDGTISIPGVVSGY